MKIIIFIGVFFISESCFSQELFKGLSNSINILNYEEKTDTTFDQFAFLENELTDKEVVFIGGGIHGVKNDGEMRLRLIKYLHEKQNFDVILIERNFYDLLLLNKYCNTDCNLEDSLSRYLDTRLDDYEYDILKYVYETKKTKKRLEIGGLDVFVDYNIMEKSPLFFLGSHNSFLYNDPNIRFLKSEINNPNADKKKMEKSLDFLRFNSLSKSFFKNDSLDNLWLNIYKNIAADYYYKHSVNKKGKIDGTYYVYRDSIMAANYLFHKKQHKGKKIIVFTSTYHITKGNENYAKLSKDVFGKYAKPMGEYILEDNNKIYSIITIFNEGKVRSDIRLKNSSNTLPKRDKNSIEYILNKQKYKSVYIDLHKLSYNGDSIFDMYPFYEEKLKSKWVDMYDGLIFIKKAEPSIQKEFFYKLEWLDVKH